MNRRGSKAMRQHMKIASIVQSQKQRLWHGTASKDDNRFRWFLSDDGSSFASSGRTDPGPQRWQRGGRTSAGTGDVGSIFWIARISLPGRSVPS
jgi:hypothetical protein